MGESVSAGCSLAQAGKSAAAGAKEKAATKGRLSDWSSSAIDQNLAFAVTRKVRPRPVSIVLPAMVLDDGV